MANRCRHLHAGPWRPSGGNRLGFWRHEAPVGVELTPSMATGASGYQPPAAATCFASRSTRRSVFPHWLQPMALPLTHDNAFRGA